MRVLHKLVIATTLLVAIIAIYYFFLSKYVTIGYISDNLLTFRAVINNNYLFFVCMFIQIYCLATAFAIPGSSIFTVIGGMLFDKFPAFLYALIAATSGSGLLFVISRYWLGNSIQRRYSKQLVAFNREMSFYGKYYLLLIRLFGLLPFGFVTMLSSLTVMPLKEFILMTCLGIMPITLFYIYAGNELGTQKTGFSFFSIGALILCLKLLVLPVMIKIMHSRIKKTKNCLEE